MKGITIPINLPSFHDLVLQALEYLRSNLVTVISDSKSKGRIDRSLPRPWHLLPSIRGFRIELSPYDWLLELFDIKKRFPNKMTFKTGKNESSNLYIDYMFKRLSKEVSLGKYPKAVDTIGTLMNSSSYQVAALNHVLTNWHRKLTYKQVKGVIRDVKRLVKSRSTALKYKRVYLDEKNKIRPLGVPAISWRIYLHMYNNCIVQGRLVTEGDKQHGYLPKRGVITAGFKLASKLSQPNIYEADFKGFFDNVTHSGLHAVLTIILKFPESEAAFIRMINQSPVKLQEVDRIPEPDRKVPFKEGDLNPDGIWSPKSSIDDLLDFYGIEEESPDLAEVSGMIMSQELTKSVGVPQGAPTSCSVATLALKGIEKKGDVVLYADDVIFFPPKSDIDPLDYLQDTSVGVRLNLAKSRGLKKDGIGLVDSFKFLGIRYYPPGRTFGNVNSGGGLLLQGLTTFCWLYKPGRFVAETRKGANLEFSNKESLISYLAIAREILLDSKYLRKMVPKISLNHGLLTREARGVLLSNKAKLLFGTVLVGPEGNIIKGRPWGDWIPDRVVEYKNPLTGFFLARMFSNSWDISIKQDFNLTYIKHSWVDSIGPKYCWQGIVPANCLNIFNASSFAVHDLINGASRLNKSRHSPIRRVYSACKRPRRGKASVSLTQSLLRSEFRETSTFSTYNPPKFGPKGEYSRRPYFVPELALILIVDSILGFPLFTGLGSLVWIKSKKRFIEI